LTIILVTYPIARPSLVLFTIGRKLELEKTVRHNRKSN